MRRRDERNEADEACYRATLALSADTPETLRACDVDRVLDDAEGRGYARGFLAWLRKQALTDRTLEALDVAVNERAADESFHRFSGGNEP